MPTFSQVSSSPGLDIEPDPTFELERFEHLEHLYGYPEGDHAQGHNNDIAQQFEDSEDEDGNSTAGVPADVQVDVEGDASALVEPFAPNVVPALLAPEVDDPDAVTDALLTRSVLQLAMRNDPNKSEYHDRPLRTYSLAKMRALYTNKQAQNAINILGDRVRLLSDDPEFVCPRDSPDVSWSPKGNYLDLAVIVPRGLGLSAILPRAEDNYMRFDFDLCMLGRGHHWRMKKAMLGFDPQGSMLWIGQCSGQDVWLAMVPNAIINREMDPVCIGAGSKGDPGVSTAAYQVIVYFFAHVLASMHYRDIDTEAYPALNDWSYFRLVNTLIQRRTHSFNLEQARSLHEHLQRLWYDWIAGAPDEYDVEGISGKSPLILAVRYGQNTRLLSNEWDIVPGEVRNWEDHIAWDEIRFYTLALASSYGAKIVESWVDIPDNEILAEYPDVYTEPDTDEREAIEDLATYPRMDNDGREVPIYTQDGYKIPRRVPGIDQNAHPCSILFDLPELGRRFANVESYDADVVDRELSGIRSECFGRNRGYPEVSVYPLGLLGSFGNMQATGAFPPFDTELRSLCQDIRQRRGNPDGDSDEDLNDEEDLDGMEDVLAIEAISMQGYNMLSHRTRDSAKFHEAQLGLTGGAAAGTYANSATAKRAALKLANKNLYTLPHDRFQHLIGDVAQVPRDIRLETVIVINMDGLRERHRTGSFLFEQIILKISGMWLRGRVWREIRPTLRVFKADTFPQVINWTSYPFTALIDRIYAEVRGAKEPVNPYTVEVLSMLDRTINFAHTGNAAVFVGVMKRAWLSLGVLEHGYPSLWPGVKRQHGRFLGVNALFWPTNDKGQPLMASYRAQLLTFGLKHVTAYKVQFLIKHAAEGFITVDFSNDHLRKLSVIQKIANTAITTIVDETVDFVYEEIVRRIDADQEAASSTTSKKRLSDLNQWAEHPHPFGYATDSVMSLVGALHTGEGPMPVALKYTTKSMSYMELCEMMYAFGNQEKPPQPKAPIRSRGATVPILKAAIPAMRGVLAEPEAASKNTIMGILRETLIAHEITRLPTAPKGGSTRVSVDLWVSLGKADKLPSRINPKYLTQEQRFRVEIEDHIAEMRDKDTNAKWNASEPRKLAMYLSRVVPPEELSLSNATLNLSGPPYESFITEVYVWVRDHLNMQKKLHQLAVFAGLLASYAPPLISVDRPTPALKPTSRRKFHDLFMALPWVPVRRKRANGSVDGKPYPVMLATLMIALYEPGSPLRERIGGKTSSESDQTGGFGNDWTTKHSSKAVLPRTLAHMGLLEAKSPAIFSSGKMGSAWDLWPDEKIEALHAEMCSRLRGDWPAYAFFELLFGTKRAREVATARSWAQPRVRGIDEDVAESSARGAKRQRVR
ncbi:hypothetical protein BV25DRAFT_1842115 [Artomyces pyxidatus]|uniref:Uncharacterized protein n=1 Tax=Artomyces pyxidatus TaxID=48021 RepID=A0ACB8SKF6_9AGAM|nr:hypothetical protein BV25DRAFT_1842115 [Artomyces pyxidatus]